MKRIIFIYFILFSIIFADDEKIGLVLAGGGAKGFAHIGVLKVIEEEKIPIDYIAGTSMGAIVGALYAMGYTATELEEIVLDHDWLKYFDERIARENTPIEKKYYDDRFIMKFSLENFKVKLPKGAVKGQHIETLLNELYIDAHNINDFSELPIEFACVATDIETGEKVVLNKGDLAKSVRASMSIPSIFTPVEIDGKLLLDGLLVSNLPVEVVKDMGADIIIGSDLIVNLKKKDELNSLIEVLDQTTNFPMIKESKEKAGVVDVSIIPQLDNYTTMDFTKAKEMIDLGEKAAREKIEELRKYSNEKKFEEKKKMRLPKIEKSYIKKIIIKGNKKYSDETIKNMIAIETPVTLKKEEITEIINELYNLGYFQKVEYNLKNNILEIIIEENIEDELKAGFNYNTEDFGELYLNFSRNGIGKLVHEFNLDTVFGKDIYIKARGRRYVGDINKLIFELSGEYFLFNEYEIYDNNKKISEVEVKRGNIGLNLGTSFATNNTLFLGLRRQFTIGKNIIDSSSVPSDRVYYTDYYLEYIHDSLDNKYFTKKGNYLDIEISGTNTAISKYQFTNYSCNGKKSIAVSDKLVLNLGLNAKILIYEKVPPVVAPSLGGFQNRKDSIEFWGLSTSQHFSSEIGSAYSELLFEFSDSVYLFCRYNLATYHDELGKDYEFVEGSGVGIGTQTVIGPVSLIIADNVDNKPMFYLNVGYYFN